MDPPVMHRVWYGDDIGSRLIRSALMPLSLLYAGATKARNALYDGGLLRQHATSLPALAVGNLSVGGTGKTPIAAELARRIQRRGETPAIVLRGYGADEPRVHELLNPQIPVIVAADRVLGIAQARERGASVAVLDDAFQHRRARRHSDVVLLSADAWKDGRRHSLPAGPWREPLNALRRAQIAVVTRKAADAERVEAVLAAVAASAPECPRAVAFLSPVSLRRVDGGDERPFSDLAGQRVTLIAAIGDPGAFERQVRAAGAAVEPFVFGDHHHFTPSQVASLATAAERADIAVCTLKDAVKLSAFWPRVARPLWYVSQAVTFEFGETFVERMLDDLVMVSHRLHHI